MTKEYIEQMKQQAEEDCKKAREDLKKQVVLLPIPHDFYKRDELIEYLVNCVDSIQEEHYGIWDFGLYLTISDFYDKLGKDPKADEAMDILYSDDAGILVRRGEVDQKFAEGVHAIKSADAYLHHDFSRYQDSEPIEFDGDIIITDPCYVSKDKDWHCWLDSPGGWSEMSALADFGFSKWIVRDTLYGDWSCTTFNLDDPGTDSYGEFCADAGLVGVFLADEALKYNPGFSEYIDERGWTVTLIKDFKGKVWVEVYEHKTVLDSDCGRLKKGDTYVSYYLCILGEGINKKTGEPIRFKTDQTGF